MRPAASLVRVVKPRFTHIMFFSSTRGTADWIHSERIPSRKTQFLRVDISDQREIQMTPRDLNRTTTEPSSGPLLVGDNSSAQTRLSEDLPDHLPPISESAAQTYIAKKLDPQLNWFDKNAQRSKLFHYLLLGISIVATSSIVVANSLHLPALSTALAVIATMTTGFSSTVKFQEHWIRYRSTATALEGLKLKYEVGMHPFEGPDKHALLIAEAEKIFENEQSQWAAKSAENIRQPISPN
jgi:hypothetical protein